MMHVHNVPIGDVLNSHGLYEHVDRNLLGVSHLLLIDLFLNRLNLKLVSPNRLVQHARLRLRMLLLLDLAGDLDMAVN